VGTLNKTDLKQRGWTDKLIATLLPPPRVEIRHNAYVRGDYTVYLWDAQVVRKAERRKGFLDTPQRRIKIGAKLDSNHDVDLLAAIFTVNRAAKRRRDAAQKYYQNGMYGFAGSSRREKETYYSLTSSFFCFLSEIRVNTPALTRSRALSQGPPGFIDR
jgi:hypothetical protein